MITIELIYVLNDVSLEAYFGWYTDCKNMHGMNNIKFDDNMLQNGSERMGYVRSECEPDEDTDCEDGYGDTNW